MLNNTEHRKTKAVSFAVEIATAPSHFNDRNSAEILYEHNNKTYQICEVSSNDAPQSTVIKLDNSRISFYDVAQIRSAFNAIDINHNGYIEMRELRKFLKRISRDSLPQGMATTILKQADKNKDGVISFDEFFQLCQAHDWLTRSFIKYCGKITGLTTEEPEDSSYEYYYIHSRIFPLVIYTFTIIQIIFFINDQLTIKAQKLHYMTHNNGSIKFHDVESFSILSATFLYDESKKYELWRFITYILVHANVLHFASNLFLILSAGIPLEVIHGCRCVLLIYCASGFAGAIGVSAISNCSYLVGSSAGAFGLLGAHFSTLILNWNEMHYKIIRILIISVFVIVNTFVCLYLTLHVSFGLTNSTIAHVSGFIMGLLTGIVTLKNIKVLEFEKQLRKSVKVIIVSIVIVSIVLTISMPNEYKIGARKMKPVKLSK